MRTRAFSIPHEILAGAAVIALLLLIVAGVVLLQAGPCALLSVGDRLLSMVLAPPVLAAIALLLAAVAAGLRVLRAPGSALVAGSMVVAMLALFALGWGALSWLALPLCR